MTDDALNVCERAIRAHDSLMTGTAEDWQHANEVEQFDAGQHLRARVKDGRAPLCVALGTVAAVGIMIGRITNPETPLEELVRVVSLVLRDGLRLGREQQAQDEKND